MASRFETPDCRGAPAPEAARTIAPPPPGDDDKPEVPTGLGVAELPKDIHPGLPSGLEFGEVVKDSHPGLPGGLDVAGVVNSDKPLLPSGSNVAEAYHPDLSPPDIDNVGIFAGAELVQHVYGEVLPSGGTTSIGAAAFPRGGDTPHIYGEVASGDGPISGDLVVRSDRGGSSLWLDLNL